MSKELPDETIKEILQLKAFDEDMARGFLLLQPNTIKWTPETGWLVWCGSHWRAELAEQKVKTLVTNALQVLRLIFVSHDTEDNYKKHIGKASPNVRNINNTVTMLQNNPDVYTSYSLFDNSPDLLNCKNGVVNLKTGELLPHSPDQYFTYCIGTEYHKKAQPVLWESFLAEAIGGGADVINFLKRAVGYSVTGHTTEEVLIYVHGPTRSGKGTFANTLLHLLGKPLSAGIGFETFQTSRGGDNQNFDLAELVPTRFIAASESDRHARLNAAMLKRLTGGDDIFCAKKGKQPFTYKPQSTIWLFSNFPANLDVDDHAAWYRLRTVLFPDSKEGKEDFTLKARLLSKESMEGILAWVIEGSMEWYEEGLKTPETVTKQTKKDREEMDYVLSFINEHYEKCDDEWIPSSDIYRQYKDWAESDGYPLKNQGQFVQSLKFKGFVTKTAIKRINGKQKRCILGLKSTKSVTL